MKLVTARVELFRNYVDSNEVKFEDTITNLVGKNECGKTAFLKALHSIKPHGTNLVDITTTKDYPRWRKRKDERENGDLGQVPLIKATFSLNDNDRTKLNNIPNISIPESAVLKVERLYNGELKFSLESTEDERLNSFLTSDLVEESIKKDVQDVKNFTELFDKLSTLQENRTKELEELEETKGEPEEVSENPVEEAQVEEAQVEEAQVEEAQVEEAQVEEAQEELPDEKLEQIEEAISLAEEINNTGTDYISTEFNNEIKNLIPTFFYYDAYSTLPGRIDLNELKDLQEENMDEDQRTASALLKMVDVTTDDLTDEDFEERTSELESSANDITQQVLDYWSQNKDIMVRLELDVKPHTDPTNGVTVVDKFLDVRLYDLRHSVTTNFKTRSSGFQWFFSFIVAFEKFRDRDDVIILLDEPGLNLHGKAQGDLLRYIEEKLAVGRQVIYTNHSPFMVNPKLLENVRLVEDLSSPQKPDIGGKVSEDVLAVHGDTSFPLQAALGYDIAQNLFIGGMNLVVEGKSDLLYLSKLSAHLEGLENKKYLNNKITIVPVGGSDKIPTFIAILGSKELDLTVLIDSNMTINQKIQDMIDKGLFDEKRLIDVGKVIKNPKANIEDLFTESEYLELYNIAFQKNITPDDISGDDSIVDRIERLIGQEYNHHSVARKLNKEFIDKLSKNTIDNFEKLFDELNKSYK